MTDETAEAVVFWTYSDDCANIRGRHNVDESRLHSHWWPLLVDGEWVGDIQVTYGDGWEFHLRPTVGHSLDVVDDPDLLPAEDEEDW